MLVASSLNSKKKDFRNPFIRKQGTFGMGPEKINKLAFERAYGQEFKGKFSPPSTLYETAKSDFNPTIHVQKT